VSFLRKLEIVSFVLTIIALYLLSIPNVHTFTVFGISMLVQMVIFYRTKQPFLFMQMVTILLFNVYNYWSWTTQGIG
jgi:glucose dehydrogenase